MQAGFLSASPAPHEAAAVIDRVNALAARARRRRIPVIYFHHEEGPELAPGVPAWELDPRLTPDPKDRRIRKRTPDCFHETSLEAELRTHGVHELIISGYATEFCIDTTARRALGLGFSVLLAADGHTTDDSPVLSGAQIRAHHNRTLPLIPGYPGRIDVVPCAALLADG